MKNSFAILTLVLVSLSANSQVIQTNQPYRKAPDVNEIPIPEMATSAAPQGTPVPASQQRTPTTMPEWEIKLSDRTVGRALARWAEQQNLPVIWDADREFAAIAGVYRAATFDQAVEAVMNDSKRTTYPLHACRYDNVLRVLHATQSCD